MTSAAFSDVAAALRFVARVVDAGSAAYGDAPFRLLLALDPAGVGWAAWGRWSSGRGHAAAARRLLARAVIAAPSRAQAWNDYAVALQFLKSPLSTAAALRAAALAPDVSDYLFNLGCERRDADYPDAAARSAAQVLRLDPTHAEGWGLSATVALLRGGRRAAERFAACALVSTPITATAMNVLGLLRARGGDRLGALRWYDRAARAFPQFAEAILNRGLALLQSGDLTGGWRDYARRFAARGYVDRVLAARPWRGEPLAGRRLFAWREQGVGDELLFAGCLPDLAATAAAVTVECDPRLRKLFARTYPTVRFVAAGGREVAESFDFHAPLGDLPRFFRQRLRDFSAAPVRLRPDSASAAAMRARLAALPAGINVGLAWKSGLMTAERAAAYTRLADWTPLFAVAGVNVVNLQYGDCGDEIAEVEAHFSARLHRWDDIDLKNDLENVAALTAALDLVICPATAAGELAAALGTPVWRMGAYDWTTLGTAVRPWFPAQRLFAPRPGESLNDIPRRIADELCGLIRRTSAPSPAADGDFDAALRLYQAGDADAAAAACAALTLAAPAAARPRHLGAVIANRRGEHERAVALLAPVAGRDDAEPAAVAALAAAFNALGLKAAADDRSSAAVGLHCRAAALNPADRAGLTNLGAVLTMLRRGRAARAVLTRALRLQENDAAAWCNLALSHEYEGDDAAALRAYEQAIRVDPQHAAAHYNAGLLLLRCGALRRGWAEHDHRFATPQFKGQGKRSAAPLWRGENLTGKRLLIWREQGVGDEIMLASCYPDIIGRAAQTIIHCDRRLLGLFARRFPQARFIPAEAPSPAHDFHIPAGTLPRRLRSDLTRFPARIGRPAVDPARAALWSERLAALGPEPKIGLAWRSGLVTFDRVAAYIDAVDWEPVLRMPGLRFVNLQYGDCREELQRVRDRFGVEVATWDDLDLKDDFENVAALVSRLDLVLSPATAVGESAAAVGAPVWRLGAPDWTWLGTTTRPWFPTMRVWAPRPGEALRDVPRRMAAALASVLSLDDGGQNSGAASARARAAFAAGDVAAARAAFSAALRVDLNAAAAWTGLGACLAEAGDTTAAAVTLARALALDPADAAALTTVGNVSASVGDYAAAAAAHGRAVRVVPGLWPAWDNLGGALAALGRDGEAEACCRRAAAGDLAAAAPRINLADALRRQGRFSEARRALTAALIRDPADPDALANMTRLLRLTEEAPLRSPWMRRAHALSPASPTVAFNRGAALLAAGRLAEGWAGYDRRYQTRELAAAVPNLPAPMWGGEPLAARHLVVWGEQGVGDQILFAGMLPDLLTLSAQTGGRVTVSVEPRLETLFRRSFPEAAVVADLTHPAVTAADLQCPVGSLGAILRPTLGDFPSRAAYLRPDTALCGVWRARLDALPAGLRVGISWRSGLLNGERRREYVGLADWAPLLTAPDVVAVNLLYGAERETADVRAQGLRLYGWDDLDLKDDFESVAALISALDLVISPATSVGELAAALGVPTWRFGLPGDWTRLGTALRPWFPVMRIFSPRPGESLSDLAGRLARRVARSPQ